MVDNLVRCYNLIAKLGTHVCPPGTCQILSFFTVVCALNSSGLLAIGGGGGRPI
jgi:hypothetical protein